MKKALNIFGVCFLIVIATAIAAPIVFEAKFENLIKELINKQVNAEVDFKDINLSLISSFPKVNLELNELSIVNYEPFVGDTLFYAKTIETIFPLSGLLKGTGQSIPINSFTITEPVINIINNTKEQTNYDIAKKETDAISEDSPNSTDTTIALSVDHYAIINGQINYIDQATLINTSLNELNHFGKGDLSVNQTTLETTTTAFISLNIEENNYLNNHSLKLDANLALNQETGRISFLENSFALNQMILNFNGYIQNSDVTEIDLNFNTPTSDFKNFIALLPEAYSQNIDQIKTQGNFTLDGFIKGQVTDNNVPNFKVNLNAKDASFQYPDFSKKVDNINLATTIANTSGNIDHTFLILEKLSLQIDEDVFSANGKIDHLPSSNPFVDFTANGTLNLTKLYQAFPMQLDNPLKGILQANINTQFSQAAIANKDYEKIKAQGDLALTNFEYKDKDLPKPITIKSSKVNFTPSHIKLDHMNLISGVSDIQANGSVNNLLGYIFNHETLQGNFTVQGSRIQLSDFMSTSTHKDSDQDDSTEDSNTSQKALKIPAFLDAQIYANVKQVIYDNLVLNQVQGSLAVKDEKAKLNNLTTEIFDGKMAVNGSISTQDSIPVFDLALGIDQFDIEKSFKGMELLTSLAPIAKALHGKFNTTLNLSGTLNPDLNPDLNSLSGDALAEILTQKVSLEDSKALSMLNNEFSFIDLEKLNLKQLMTSLSFKNGNVAISPFTIQYDDVTIEITGSHGFDNSLNYTSTFLIPAKYFGNEAGHLLSKLNKEDIKNISVPVKANINGTFTHPSIKTDVKGAASQLTQQLIEVQKKKFLDQGKDVIKDGLGGLLNNNNSENSEGENSNDNGSSKDDIKNTVSDIIGGLFGKKKKKKKDSIQN